LESTRGMGMSILPMPDFPVRNPPSDRQLLVRSCFKHHSPSIDQAMPDADPNPLQLRETFYTDHFGPLTEPVIQPIDLFHPHMTFISFARLVIASTGPLLPAA
jgi:hypothetical protein